MGFARSGNERLKLPQGLQGSVRRKSNLIDAGLTNIRYAPLARFANRLPQFGYIAVITGSQGAGRYHGIGVYLGRRHRSMDRYRGSWSGHGRKAERHGVFVRPVQSDFVPLVGLMSF
jgi:hypothetical protein